MVKCTVGEKLDIKSAEKLMSLIRMNRREQLGVMYQYLNGLGIIIESYIISYNEGVEDDYRLLTNEHIKTIADNFSEYMQCLKMSTKAFKEYKKSKKCKIRPAVMDAYIKKAIDADIMSRSILIAEVIGSCEK